MDYVTHMLGLQGWERVHKRDNSFCGEEDLVQDVSDGPPSSVGTELAITCDCATQPDTKRVASLGACAGARGGERTPVCDHGEGGSRENRHVWGRAERCDNPWGLRRRVEAAKVGRVPRLCGHDP